MGGAAARGAPGAPDLARNGFRVGSGWRSGADCGFRVGSGGFRVGSGVGARPYAAGMGRRGIGGRARSGRMGGSGRRGPAPAPGFEAGVAPRGSGRPRRGGGKAGRGRREASYEGGVGGGASGVLRSPGTDGRPLTREIGPWLHEPRSPGDGRTGLRSRASTAPLPQAAPGTRGTTRVQRITGARSRPGRVLRQPEEGRARPSCDNRGRWTPAAGTGPRRSGPDPLPPVGRPLCGRVRSPRRRHGWRAIGASSAAAGCPSS